MISKKNKQGLSAVVAALMLILLVLALVAILWTVVKNLVQNKLDEAGSCLDTFDKVTINDAYTCYNVSNGELRIAIGVKDIDVNSVILGVSTQGESKSIELFTTKNITNPDWGYYNGTYDEDIILPGRNSGRTYIFNVTSSGMNGNPKSIEVVPIVGGNQCGTSDSIVQISSCTSL